MSIVILLPDFLLLDVFNMGGKEGRGTMTSRMKDGTGSSEEKVVNMCRKGKNMREKIESPVQRSLESFEKGFERSLVVFCI